MKANCPVSSNISNVKVEEMLYVYSVLFFVSVFVVVFTLLSYLSVVAQLALCFIAIWLTDYIVFRFKIPFLPIRIVPGHRYKAVLVTGCDSGFGHEVARRLDNIGVKVFAGCLYPLGSGAVELKTISSNNLEILKLDITSEDDIQNALQQVTCSLENKELWAVVNSAEVLTFAETELCSLSNFQHVFQVNVMGTLRLTQAFLPLIRASRGRIVFVPGIAGWITLNGLVAYSMSKHAVVALADGLRREMLKFGVSVHTIIPWTIRTNGSCEETLRHNLKNNWRQTSQHVSGDYGEDFLEESLDFVSLLHRNCSIHEVVGDIIEASVGENPKIIYEEGTLIFPKLLSYLPTQFLDFFIYLYSPKKIILNH